MNNGLTYVPKYIRQESDLEYGEKVTHENYNEKLNLNSTQGDYNTDVLLRLFTRINPEETYHIAYLDKAIQDISNTMSGFTDDVGALAEDNNNIHEHIDSIDADLTAIEDGTTPIGHATTADSITSGATAGPSKYYGTDANSNLGFIDLPEFLYAIDMESSTGVNGVYYVPALNSVTEPMLSAAVREKLNREAVVDYDYLDNRPQINSVTLTGNKSLNDLGIQPVGDYVTNANLASTLSDYYTITAAQSWVNTQLESYATTSALSTTNDNLSITTTKANNAYDRAYACARVGVNAYVSNPQNGDIYFAV